jgi:hypothetical protein
MPPANDSPDSPSDPLPGRLQGPKDEAVDPDFEREAQRAEEEAVLEKELESTFPTSDPSSSWAGKDPEPDK